ncbi:transcriptional regulator [Natrialba sp. SSL1]|uniref:transcriptional regulator n=1 Tax=Natrialba sp. SSL1 TaxID=1869245 RepID=UPI001113D41D|nr:transcriptional regulator [Natrialba sp. SSL1]
MSRERIEREVLKALAAQAPLHVMDLSNIITEHPVSVDLACARLHKQNQTFPVGRGVYDVTDRGWRRLEALDDGQQESSRLEG